MIYGHCELLVLGTAAVPQELHLRHLTAKDVGGGIQRFSRCDYKWLPTNMSQAPFRRTSLEVNSSTFRLVDTTQKLVESSWSTRYPMTIALDRAVSGV